MAQMSKVLKNAGFLLRTEWGPWREACFLTENNIRAVVQRKHASVWGIENNVKYNETWNQHKIASWCSEVIYELFMKCKQDWSCTLSILKYSSFIEPLAPAAR